MQPTPVDLAVRRPQSAQPLYRKLRRDERGRFVDHLLRLDPDDRRMRFCAPVNDEFLRGYCERPDWWKTTALGCYIDGALRGAAELVPIADGASNKAELAITVERAYQDRGIGSALLRKSLVLARNRFVDTVVMICLAENRKMRHIARKFDAALDFHGSEVEGRLWPPFPTALSLMEEAQMESEAIFRATFGTSSPRPS